MGKQKRQSKKNEIKFTLSDYVLVKTVPPTWERKCTIEIPKGHTLSKLSKWQELSPADRLNDFPDLDIPYLKDVTFSHLVSEADKLFIHSGKMSEEEMLFAEYQKWCHIATQLNQAFDDWCAIGIYAEHSLIHLRGNQSDEEVFKALALQKIVWQDFQLRLIAHAAKKMRLARNNLERLLNNKARQEAEKRTGSIVHDAVLAEKGLTNEDYWYDLHTRLGIPIADIADKEHKKHGIRKNTMEQRIIRGIAAVRAKRAAMDRNYE